MLAGAVPELAGAVVELAGAVVGVVGLAVAAGAVAVVVDGTADCGEVAACACRENSSKMVRIPAAKIATCTARRAM